MRYVDGFVIPILKKNLPAYFKIAKKASKVWLDHGALEYRECAGDDLDIKGGMATFPQQMKIKSGETVVFAWIVYKSRAHRDRVNGMVMSDPRIEQMMKVAKKMPFDMERMVVGGFKIMVDA